MPKTKFQKLIFALLSVMISVPIFVFYNMAVESRGMSNEVFIKAPQIIILELVFAFLMQIFIAGPLSMKTAFSIINPREEKPYIVKLVIICSTIAYMCPLMSLTSTILYNGLTVELLAQWMEQIVINFHNTQARSHEYDINDSWKATG